MPAEDERTVFVDELTVPFGNEGQRFHFLDFGGQEW